MVYYVRNIKMDKKLMPPSHFSKLLCEEEDKLPLPRPITIKLKRDNTTANSSGKTSNNSEKYAELEKIRLENENLKMLLEHHKNRLQTEDKQASKEFCSSSQSTFMKYQIKHIDQLQNNISELTSAVLRKDDEIAKLNHLVNEANTEISQLQCNCDEKSKYIMEQNKEIKELNEEIEYIKQQQKDENKKIESKHTNQIKDLMDDQKEKCRIFEEKVLKLMNEIEAKQKIHEIEIEKLCNQKSEQQTNLKLQFQSEISSLKNQNNVEKQEMESKNQKLTNEIKNLQEHCKQVTKEYEKLQIKSKELEDLKYNQENDLKVLQKEIENEKLVNSNLQAYVSEIQKEDLQRSEWRKTKQEFQKALELSEQEILKLEKTLELQTIRFNAVNKILATQEETIATQTQALPAGNLINKEEIVLSRWREKVFELLVQVKSEEISSKESFNKWKVTEKNLLNQLKEKERCCTILENQRQSTEADLQIQKQKFLTLDSENKALSNNFGKQSKKLHQCEQLLLNVEQVISENYKAFNEEVQTKMGEIMERNIRSEERIAFANNRLRTIQDLLTRRSNVQRANKQKNQGDNSIEPCKNEDTLSKEREQQLLTEIELLIKERDTLSQQLKRDAAVFENAVTDFKKQEKSMEENLKLLQKQFEEKVEESFSASKTIENLQENLQTLERKCNEAEKQVAQIQNHHDEEVNRKINEKEEVWQSEKVDLESKLSEAKTQVAKGLVSLRQAERSAARELKATTDALEEKFQKDKEDLLKFKKKAKHLEQDNNILMTTLRQEGLIAAYKANRHNSRKMRQELQIKQGVDNKENSTKDMNKNPHLKHKENPSSTESSGVKNMLQELVALTDEVLKEDED